MLIELQCKISTVWKFQSFNFSFQFQVSISVSIAQSEGHVIVADTWLLDINKLGGKLTLWYKLVPPSLFIS